MQEQQEMFVKHLCPPSQTYENRLTFDYYVRPTDLKLIGIIYSSSTIYLPNLKVVGYCVLVMSSPQDNGDRPSSNGT